jgi:hypothetical protein
VQLTFALGLAIALLAVITLEGAARAESSAPWIVAPTILKNGEHSGSGVYLKSGLVITAAHLTDINAEMGARA